MGWVRVDWQASLDLTGRVLLYVSVPLSFPLSIALLYGESVRPFVVAIAVTLALGWAFRALPGDPGNLGPREAFLAVAAIWKQIGYNVIFMIAAMNNVPDTLTETAALDGVGRLRRLVSVYVPIMTPTLFFLVVINTIYAFFSTFAFVDLLTSGGPSNATNILIFDLYQEGFSFFNFGVASAKSVVLFLVVGALMLVQFRVTDKYSYYGG